VEISYRRINLLSVPYEMYSGCDEDELVVQKTYSWYRVGKNLTTVAVNGSLFPKLLFLRKTFVNEKNDNSGYRLLQNHYQKKKKKCTAPCRNARNLRAISIFDRYFLCKEKL
jgi:hypothetical protein